jgi:hypothetical protein
MVDGQMKSPWRPARKQRLAKGAHDETLKNVMPAKKSLQGRDKPQPQRLYPKSNRHQSAV